MRTVLRHPRLLPAIVGLALLLAACTPRTAEPPTDTTATLPDRPGCQAPQPAEDPGPGSFEGANLIAAGEMFRTYGSDADPVRDQVIGDIVTLDEHDVWQLDTTVAVTVDDTRRTDTWRLWIGFVDNRLVVLCADGPDDITWPPAHDTP